MTTRLLPPEEWSKLADTPLSVLVGQAPPAAVKVLVVEDDDGQLLGCWTLTTVLHAEGVWVRDDARRRGGVHRRLLHGMQELVAQMGANGVWTGADSEEVAALIMRLGGQPIPFASFYLPFSRTQPCQ